VLAGEIEVTVDGQTVTVHAGQQLNTNVQGDPPHAVGPLPNPIPAQNPASNAVRCAIDPVITHGCNQALPINLSIVAVPNDPILRPDGGEGIVIGPKPPPKPGPSPFVCRQLGQPCTTDNDCCLPGQPPDYLYCDTYYTNTCQNGG